MTFLIEAQALEKIFDNCILCGCHKVNWHR